MLLKPAKNTPMSVIAGYVITVSPLRMLKHQILKHGLIRKYQHYDHTNRNSQDNRDDTRGVSGAQFRNNKIEEMNKIIGFSIIALFFIALFIALVWAIDLKTALVVFFITAVLSSILIFAIHLISAV
jgi:hypothetical protein